MNKESIPWVEKYRPSEFEEIILDDNNKELFKNIIKTRNFPNLLLHGPPGIGKTTVIINLINKFKENNNDNEKSSVIHLNASDERGIDIIRNNIYNFVRSDNLFSKGTKFVILDEVDYMTKIAQQALKCLIQNNNSKMRYCLICNYISRIDFSLQYEFIKVRFNKLPKIEIQNFLKAIVDNEKLNISNKIILNIIEYFDNDIRSMINYIQSKNYNKTNILDDGILDKLLMYNLKNDYTNYIKYIDYVQKKCNIDLMYLLTKYIYFLIYKYIDIIDSETLDNYEFLVHNTCNETNKTIFYILFNCRKRILI